MDQRKLAFIATIFCIVCALSSLSAQETGIPPSESSNPAEDEDAKIAYKAPHFQFSFIGVEAIKDLCYLSYPQDPKYPPKIVPLQIYAQQLSSVFKYDGPNPLRLYWMPKSADEELSIAASYTIPKNEKRRLFMLCPTGELKNKRPVFELLNFNDSEQSAPAGTYQVINLSKIPVAGRIGKDVFKPFPAYVPPKRFRPGALDLDIYVYLETENRVTNTHRSKLNASTDFRYWFCIFPYHKNNRDGVIVRFIRERLIAQEYDPSYFE